MGRFLAVLLLACSAIAQQLPGEDATRIAEFYRVAAKIQDQVWANWSKVPDPLLLITDKTEFLIRYPDPPKQFTRISEKFYARPLQFDPHLQATFPAFGPLAVIVVGEAPNTDSKTSTPWLFTVMHEHFHQLQWAQPGYIDAVNQLNLSGGDKTGMWMLNYPFPYERPDVVQGFSQLRDMLLQLLAETDDKNFKKIAPEYISLRKKVFARLSRDDHKYFGFQLWQEGIARYTQVKSAEVAAGYSPSPEFAALPDYEPFAGYAARLREETLNELREADIGKLKRIYVYPFGAAEGMLLDRLNPDWKGEYFVHPLATDALFMQ